MYVHIISKNKLIINVFVFPHFVNYQLHPLQSETHTPVNNLSYKGKEWFRGGGVGGGRERFIKGTLTFFQPYWYNCKKYFCFFSGRGNGGITTKY